MIAVGLCFYNDLESLKRGVPTYADDVDYIFAIDGRFSLYDGPDYSTPETVEYLKSFPNVIYDQFIGMEHEKRQRYVELCKKHNIDYLLIIDSDEYILTNADWKTFKGNAEKANLEHPNDNFFGIDFRYSQESIKPELFSPFPRLWIRPQECEYYKTHCFFKNRSGVVRSSSYAPKVEGIRMGLGDELRTPEYLNSISRYQGKMLDYEIPIRHELRGQKVY